MFYSFIRRVHLVTAMVLMPALTMTVHAGTEVDLAERLSKQAPGLDRAVLDKAISAVSCARRSGLASAHRLAVIDFSRPSTDRRLWIFDLNQGTLLLRELVAHGKKSGGNLAKRFSNVEGSHQSSLGLFLAQESYSGSHGYSLRMDGLEPGINDRARERAIVIHGAEYVDESWIERYGRIGRSHGCPAVPSRVASDVVDHLKDGQLVFSYYPDEKWLESSPLLNCRGDRLAEVPEAPASRKG